MLTTATAKVPKILIPLPPHADAGQMQADSNSMLRKAQIFNLNLQLTHKRAGIEPQ